MTGEVIYTDEEIQKMQDLEQAQLDKAYEIGYRIGYEEGKGGNMKLYYFDENDEEYKEYKGDSLCSKCSEFNKSCIGATDVTECKSFKMREEKIDKEYFRKLWEKVEGADNVDHPNHYLGTESLECIDVMEFALGEDGFAYYCIGNIFKYLWRHDKKNGVEDLEKAKKYLQFLELRKICLSGPVNELAERVISLYESVA